MITDLSGGIDGSICLWQFNAPKENALMVTYRLASNPRVNKIHFNSRGTKFGSCDMSGKLSLWRFDANEASLKPFQVRTLITSVTRDRSGYPMSLQAYIGFHLP